MPDETRALTETEREPDPRLVALARQHRPPPICWVTGDNPGDDLCPDCADKRAAATGEISDGGWDAHRESDGTSACEDCGCDLGYSLTTYGTESEIEHWLGNPSQRVDPCGAYNVIEIIEGARNSLRPDLIEAAWKVHDQEVERLPEDTDRRALARATGETT